MTNLLDLIDLLILTIFLVLLVYITLAKSKRPVSFPFIVFSLIQSIDAYIGHVIPENLNVSSDTFLSLMRIQWAFAMFIPASLIHMTLYLHGKKQKPGILLATWASYILGFAFTILILATDVVIGTSSVYAPSNAIIIGSMWYGPSIKWILGWLLPMMGVGTLSLYNAAKYSDNTRIRADAHRLLLPWSIYILSIVAEAIPLAFPLIETTSLVLVILHRVLVIVSGLFLARGILRFGSPFGRPIDYRLSPLVLPIMSLIIIEALMIQSIHPSDAPLLRVKVVVISLLAGIFLSRPELLRSTARWLGPSPPAETVFLRKIRYAWKRCASQKLDSEDVKDLLNTLREEVEAEYVHFLEKREDADDEPALSFGDLEHGPGLKSTARHLVWPLSEDGQAPSNIKTNGLPGRASLVLPVQKQHNLTGVLIIGESRRGGEYSPRVQYLAELLTDLLSFIKTEDFDFERQLGQHLSAEPEPSFPLSANVLVRTFGRLEILVRSPEGLESTYPSKRARQVLAYLLLHHPQPVPVGELMTQFWPDNPPQASANNLYVAIYALRRTFEPSLRRGGDSKFITFEEDCYHLKVNRHIWVDAFHFEKLLEGATEHIERGRLSLGLSETEKAISLFRHPFLDDPTLELPAEVEIRRHGLYRQFHTHLHILVDNALGKKDWDRAERTLLRALEIEPEDDVSRMKLMLVYSLQRQDALEKGFTG